MPTSIKNKQEQKQNGPNKKIFSVWMRGMQMVASKYNVWFTLAVLMFPATSLCAENNENDAVFRPSFRSGHNLSLLFTGERSSWYVSSQNNTASSDQVPSLRDGSFVPSVYFRYAYHIPIISGFGFFIGSTTGFILAEGPYGDLAFSPGYGIAFPTVMGGLTMNFGLTFRVLAGAEYGAVWYPKMFVTTLDNTRHDLSPAPNMAAFFMGGDYYVSSNTAVTIQAGLRSIREPCLSDCSNTMYINSLSIHRESYYMQVGPTWSLGGFK